MTDNLTDVVEQTETFLDTLVGDGKKYSSDEELARAYRNADLHIRELRDELKDEREDKRMLNDVLKELRTDPEPKSAQPTHSDNATVATPETGNVKQLVQEAMSEQEGARAAKRNMDTSLDLLTEEYGSRDSALAAIRSYMGDDESKKALVNQIGNTDPAALKSLITSNTAPVQHSEPNTPGIKHTESANVVLSAGSELTWNQCREIKKKDPTLYKSLEFRQKMELASSRDPDFFTK